MEALRMVINKKDIDELLEKASAENGQEKLDAIKKILDLLKSENAITIDLWLDKVKKKSKINKGRLRKELEKLQQQKPDKKNKNLDPKLKEKALQILKNEDVIEWLADIVSKQHVGDRSIIILLILSGVSPSLDNKKLLIFVNAVGVSGKGKTAVEDDVAVIFTDSKTITSSSAKSLIYATESNVLNDGMILILDESEASAELAAIERSVTDASNINPTHWTIDENRKFMQLVIKEKIIIWRNSVSTPDDEQLNNRYMIVNVDESKKQDKEVFEKQKQMYGYNQFIDKNNDSILVAQALTTLIKEEKVKVIIPFVDYLEGENIENRRSPKKLFSLVHAIVSINRYQRKQVKDFIKNADISKISNANCYIATISDVLMAMAIWQQFGSFEKSKVSEEHLKILKLLPTEELAAVDRNYLANKLKCSSVTADKKVKKLIDNNLATSNKIHDYDAGTTKWIYWALTTLNSFNISIKVGFIGDREAIERMALRLLERQSDISFFDVEGLQKYFLYCNFKSLKAQTKEGYLDPDLIKTDLKNLLWTLNPELKSTLSRLNPKKKSDDSSSQAESGGLSDFFDDNNKS
jgi:hypothetical protein